MAAPLPASPSIAPPTAPTAAPRAAPRATWPVGPVGGGGHRRRVHAGLLRRPHVAFPLVLLLLLRTLSLARVNVGLTEGGP